MQDVNLDNHLHGALFYNSLKLKKMKSLNFQKLNLRKEDILSKTQMKNILGGYDGGAGNGGCKADAFCSIKNGNTITIGTCNEVDTKLGCQCVCSLVGGSGC